MDRAGPPPKDKVEALKAVAKNAGVNKTQLQSLCAVNGLPKTGNKPDLVKRLVDGEYALSWPSPPYFLTFTLPSYRRRYYRNAD